VAWSTAMAAVEGHRRPVVDDPVRIGAVAELGVDETAFSRSGLRRRPGVRDGRGRPATTPSGRCDPRPFWWRRGFLAGRGGTV
jgi:hypothetical protein